MGLDTVETGRLWPMLLVVVISVGLAAAEASEYQW